MNITVNEELRSFIDPLTDIEYAALERSLLAEGCRDALVLWGEVLIDGHNRYAICRKHGIDFKAVQNTSFAALDDVMLWVIDNHLARRSVSDFQRGVLALRKKELVAARAAQRRAEADAARAAAAAGQGATSVEDNAEAAAEAEAGSPAVAPEPLATREDIARVARVSSNTISQIERIQKAATPELVDAVRAGTISINAAATVATLPEAEQKAAVAGGRKELQQAAKQVRDQRVAARPPKEAPAGDVDELRAEVTRLKARVALLSAENEALSAKLAVLSA